MTRRRQVIIKYRRQEAVGWPNQRGRRIVDLNDRDSLVRAEDGAREQEATLAGNHRPSLAVRVGYGEDGM